MARGGIALPVLSMVVLAASVASAADAPVESPGLVDPDFISHHVDLMPLVDRTGLFTKRAPDLRPRLFAGALAKDLSVPPAEPGGVTVPATSHPLRLDSISIGLDHGVAFHFGQRGGRPAPVKSQVGAAFARIAAQFLDGRM